jgi:hypothetical protein
MSRENRYSRDIKHRQLKEKRREKKTLEKQQWKKIKIMYDKSVVFVAFV